MAEAHEGDAEILIAHFVELKIRQAADLLIKEKQQGITRKDFREYLFEVWKTNDGIKKFYIEDQYLLKTFPDLTGKDQPIIIPAPLPPESKTHGEAGHINGKYAGLTLMIPDISKLPVEQIQQAINRTITTIYHECEHMHFESGVGEPEDCEEFLYYLMDEAETRAHSKQLAYIYAAQFPKQKFDYAALKKFIFASLPSTDKNYNLVRLLELMHDPASFQTKNKEYSDYIQNKLLTEKGPIKLSTLKAAFDKYMNYIAVFVEHLNQHITPKWL